MSEYQYYEFQAIDRPLTDSDMSELRDISSRATITTSSFVNTYQWGDLKADPLRLLEKYFDAFLYVASWGSHMLWFRIPENLFPAKVAKAYSCPDVFSIKKVKGYYLLGFISEIEPDDWESGEGWLSALISLRQDILRGDYRAFYLAWLQGVGLDLVSENKVEPPVPLGLKKLNASLNALIEFLRVDFDLLDTAIEESGELNNNSFDQSLAWVKKLPKAQKDAAIAEFIHAGDGNRFKKLANQYYSNQSNTNESPQKFRKVSHLLRLSEIAYKKRIKKEAADKEKKRIKEEQAEVEKRNSYLELLSRSVPQAWKKIEGLVEKWQAKYYEEAVSLLIDLQDAATLIEGERAFRKKISTFVISIKRRRLYCLVLNGLVFKHYDFFCNGQNTQNTFFQ